MECGPLSNNPLSLLLHIHRVDCPVGSFSRTSCSPNTGDLSQHKQSGHKWSRGTIYDSIDGPAGPLLSSYLVRPDHLCIDINGPGKT